MHALFGEVWRAAEVGHPSTLLYIIGESLEIRYDTIRVTMFTYNWYTAFGLDRKES